ncbi:hypothetical protein NBG4_860009 [Candidatus Sulfobium mesophilum]|uniref:Tyr recombinase domain-containing protein n=1 Tax=Candidatus Sulfobium mesophilum TaxID=2016548 RepID=A0A2U3QKT6_9BACT|nr:hypothetical protein NBG4_860009 [Candidatus Sulfobium mesophilum]
MQKGVDLYKVSKLLGHADLSTTQRYAHHYPGSLRDGVRALDELNSDTVVGEIEKTAQFLHTEICTG